MRRTLAAVAATTLAMAAALLAAPSAHGAPPSGVVARCGAVLTTDGYLAKDLKCADGRGITLAAGVTLDLRGHTLAGPGKTTQSVAVTINNATPSTIKNGAIRDWGTAVAPRVDEDFAPAPTKLHALRVTDTGAGADALHGSRYDITRSTFTRTGLALAIFRSGPSTITDSVLIDSGADVVGSRLTITNTVMTRSAAACADGSLYISGSVLTGAGVYLENGCSGSSVTDSVFKRAEQAIGIGGGPYSTPTQVLRNTFSGNDVAVLAYAAIHLADNEFTRNGQAVVVPNPENEEGRELTMERNTLTKNGDAVYAEGRAWIKDTRAYKNSGWGIYAPNATDLGGNVAYGNGTEPQCVGVVCAARR